mmetsp:Transcript_34528/g.83522  ORF Transcript_34528/g.83522 Transcript_34528/m.83522 type:complete len:226 (-) Transcript_34528:42-719(-)
MRVYAERKTKSRRRGENAKKKRWGSAEASQDSKAFVLDAEMSAKREELLRLQLHQQEFVNRKLLAALKEAERKNLLERKRFKDICEHFSKRLADLELMVKETQEPNNAPRSTLEDPIESTVRAGPTFKDGDCTSRNFKRTTELPNYRKSVRFEEIPTEDPSIQFDPEGKLKEFDVEVKMRKAYQIERDAILLGIGKYDAEIERLRKNLQGLRYGEKSETSLDVLF